MAEVGEGRDYRVHLDGYNILPMLTGETEESPRKEIFYFSDDGDLMALRYADWTHRGYVSLPVLQTNNSQ